MGSTLSWPASRKRPLQSKLGDKLAPKFNKTLERLFAFAFCALLLLLSAAGRGGVAWRHELSINLPATNQRDVQLMWPEREREGQIERPNKLCSRPHSTNRITASAYPLPPPSSSPLIYSLPTKHSLKHRNYLLQLPQHLKIFEQKIL